MEISVKRWTVSVLSQNVSSLNYQVPHKHVQCALNVKVLSIVCDCRELEDKFQTTMILIIGC